MRHLTSALVHPCVCFLVYRELCSLSAVIPSPRIGYSEVGKHFPLSHIIKFMSAVRRVIRESGKQHLRVRYTAWVCSETFLLIDPVLQAFELHEAWNVLYASDQPSDLFIFKTRAVRPEKRNDKPANIKLSLKEGPERCLISLGIFVDLPSFGPGSVSSLDINVLAGMTSCLWSGFLAAIAAERGDITSDGWN